MNKFKIPFSTKNGVGACDSKTIDSCCSKITIL